MTIAIHSQSRVEDRNQSHAHGKNSEKDIGTSAESMLRSGAATDDPDYLEPNERVHIERASTL
jgi:hypothetical protein